MQNTGVQRDDVVEVRMCVDAFGRFAYADQPGTSWQWVPAVVEHVHDPVQGYLAVMFLVGGEEHRLQQVFPGELPGHWRPASRGTAEALRAAIRNRQGALASVEVADV